MGNKYSQIENSAFPSTIFALSIKYPDTIHILNIDPDLMSTIIDLIHSLWEHGLKIERKNRNCIELKLSNSPFSNDFSSTDKLVQINNVIINILSAILSANYNLISTGDIFKSFERSVWLFQKSKDNDNDDNDDLSSASNNTPIKITSIIIDGWNKLILNNIEKQFHDFLSSSLMKIPKIHVINMQYRSGTLMIEFEGQPWDNNKTNSLYSPLLLLQIIRCLISSNFTFFCKSHVTGYTDTLFFINDFNSINEEDVFAISLNSIDELRTYDAPSAVVKSILKSINDNWVAGVKSDVVRGGVWTAYLKGSPWNVQDWDKDSLFQSRLLLLKSFGELKKFGNWQLYFNFKFYRSLYDKGLFIMIRKNSSEIGNRIESDMFCISPHDVDRLSLTLSPSELRSVFGDNLIGFWKRGIREDSYENGCYEYILEGKPWMLQDESFGDVNLEGIGFFCWVIETVLQNKYRFVGSADICSSTSYFPIDYIFEKDK